MAHEFPIGIDFGVTYSLVAVCRDGNVDTISNDHGNIKTPSCVSFTKNGKVFGDLAFQNVEKKPTETIYGMKSLLGRCTEDPLVQRKIISTPFTIINQRSGHPVYEIEQNWIKRNTTFTPEELSVDLIHHLKLATEICLKHPVHKAVITVPGYYNNLQREATKTVCEKAGLQVMSMVNDTTAAAIAYFTKKRFNGKSLVLVLDVGGGSVNTSVIYVNDQDYHVLSTTGGADAGGDDYDDVIFQFFRKEFWIKYRKDVMSKKKSISKLKNACEKAKRNVSFDTNTKIEIECLYDDIDFTLRLTRSDFEKLNQHLFEKTQEYITRAIQLANLKGQRIEYALLVGGSTRIPKMKEIVQVISNCRELKTDINLEESVAHGAALLAKSISDHFLNVRLSVTEKTTDNFSMVVEGKAYEIFCSHSTYPTKKPSIFKLYFQENQIKRQFKDYEICILIDKSRKNIIHFYQGQLFLKTIVVKSLEAHEMHLWFSIDGNGLLNIHEYDVTPRQKDQETVDRTMNKQDALEPIYTASVPEEKRGNYDSSRSQTDENEIKKSEAEPCFKDSLGHGIRENITEGNRSINQSPLGSDPVVYDMKGKTNSTEELNLKDAKLRYDTTRKEFKLLFKAKKKQMTTADIDYVAKILSCAKELLPNTVNIQPVDYECSNNLLKSKLDFIRKF